MPALHEPAPVMVIAAVLTPSAAPANAVFARLAEQFGKCLFESSAYPFTATDYYANEMGEQLVRRLVAFERPAARDALPEMKRFTIGIESATALQGNRRVNIDIGYIDYHKVVLASTKEGPHKLYLGKGIWGDITLLYRNGSFEPLPWTFPDFRSGMYNEALCAIRQLYKKQRQQPSFHNQQEHAAP